MAVVRLKLHLFFLLWVQCSAAVANLRSKQLLKDGNLSETEISRLNSSALGLRDLGALPLPWQQRCSSLHEHPHLILEVLLMRKQLQSASKFLLFTGISSILVIHSYRETFLFLLYITFIIILLM